MRGTSWESMVRKSKRMLKGELTDTSEATVKKWVKDLLNEFSVYYFMPVQTGYGAAGVDFHCVVRTQVSWPEYKIIVPVAFFIETKEFGKEPTPRQEEFAKERKMKQGAETFVIDGMVGVHKLRVWLEALRDSGER